MAAVLLAAVFVAGLPGLNSPWIAGDEMIFIVNNDDVTGAGRTEPLGQRLIGIFRHVHEDLYQPIPILTYALEWTLWGEQRVEGIRRTDLLLHGVNALLLWNLISVFLRRRGGLEQRLRSALAWALAMLWALHPALVLTYAADMGRTHLLSTMFGLLSLRLHVAGLASTGTPGQVGWFLLSMASLVAANLSKVLAGWPIVVLVLEAGWLGWRAALQNPRIYLVTVISGGFAALTYETTRESGMLTDARLALFGDRVSRSFLGAWLYVRDIFLPWLVSPWHLPDPRTGYSYWAVWAGAGAFVGSVALAAWGWRRRWGLAAGLGLTLFWAQLLPVIGLIGARVAAAQDRYLYLPLAGLMLALGAMLQRMCESGEKRSAFLGPAAILCALLLAGLCIPLDREMAAVARSTFARAERVVERNPGDPRALEMQAAAYAFLLARPGSDRVQLEPAAAQQRFRETILLASKLARSEGNWFRGASDRGAFHRALSFQLWAGGFYAESLSEAEQARQVEPDSPMSWIRLAFAYRSLKRYEQAAAAYERATSLMTEATPDRVLRLLEHAELLLNSLGDARAARTRFAAVLDSVDESSPWLVRAMVGLALCEIRAGEGARGRELAEAALARDPARVEAALALGEYHLRSHHWEEAAKVYSAILIQDPAHYPALRGFQAVCEQTGAYSQAALAWADAARKRPGDRALRSFRVWSAAVAGDPRAEELARQVLEEEPRNALALLAQFLIAVRAGRLEDAIDLTTAVARGDGVPEAMELERGEKFIRLALGKGELWRGAMLAAVALRLERGDREGACEMLRTYQTEGASDDEARVIERLRERFESGG